MGGGGVCPEFTTKNQTFTKKTMENRGKRGCDKGRDNTVDEDTHKTKREKKITFLCYVIFIQ